MSAQLAASETLSAVNGAPLDEKASTLPRPLTKTRGYLPGPSSFTGRMIRITIGKGKKEFAAHKALLCDQSVHFNKALNGSFREAQENLIHMPQADPDTFGRFVAWLYTRCIDDGQDTKSKDESSLSLLSISALYVFAYQHGIPHLQNHAIDAWHGRFIRTWTFESCRQYLTYVYENTPENCKFRQFLVEVFGLMARSQMFKEKEEIGCGYPAAFLLALCARLCSDAGDRDRARRTEPKSVIEKMHLSQYYEDMDGKKCDG